MAISVCVTGRITDSGAITKIICPECKEKLRGVILTKDSRVSGLMYRCRKCGSFLQVTTE